MTPTQKAEKYAERFCITFPNNDEERKMNSAIVEGVSAHYLAGYEAGREDGKADLLKNGWLGDPENQSYFAEACVKDLKEVAIERDQLRQQLADYKDACQMKNTAIDWLKEDCEKLIKERDELRTRLEDAEKALNEVYTTGQFVHRDECFEIANDYFAKHSPDSAKGDL